jgi:molecular chaperone GrpE
MAARESEKRPAGAPKGWDAKAPAGAPETPAEVEETAAKEPETAAKETGDDVTEDLDALLADVQRERDEYLELARRAKADFENYRKRAARETSEAEKRGKASLARELVPAIDNLERALRAAGVEPGAERPAGDPVEEPSEEVSAQEALARGVALVYGELQATLARAGVEPFDPVGERFDPSLHEALATRSADGAESGVVLETVERGYRLDGQVLRPARVIVSA